MRAWTSEWSRSRYPTLLVAIWSALLVAAVPVHAAGTLGGEATLEPVHLFLVEDCVSAGWALADIGVKCFESVASVNDVLWGTSGIDPSASNPALVDIGPGEFDGPIVCSTGQGFTTFRGAGRAQTIIKGQVPSGIIFRTAMYSDGGCDSVDFRDMKLDGGTIGFGVYWTGGGSSTWSDVDLEGEFFGWYDIECGSGSNTDPPVGVHYFFGSRVTGGGTGYFSSCGDTWFYGGEILAAPALKGSLGSPKGVWVNLRGSFHAFGTAIRVSTVGLTSGTGTAEGVVVGRGPTTPSPDGYGEFHHHGGIVSMNTSNLANVTAIGLAVDDPLAVGDARAHTLGTAFAINAASGTSSKRVAGTGTIQSPLLWQAGSSPPTGAGDVIGQGMFVDTDAGGEAHLMVFDPACAGAMTPDGGPWRDQTNGNCRTP